MASMAQISALGLYERPGGRVAPAPEATLAALPSGSPRIWAVGGGKGGVGKSVVAANLAAAIAGTGRRCAIVDADLGAANLHTLLGVSRPRRTLSQFLSGEVDSLSELMVQTSVRNLWLVSGNQALLEMANPRHSRKEMLFRHIRRLEVDELLARRRLVVVTPEPTSVENAEHFLNAAFLRSLRDTARHSEVRRALLRIREDRGGRRVRSPRELVAQVRQIDASAARRLEEAALDFAPILLVNQVRSAEQRRVGPELAATCRERLGVPIEFAGSLDVDPGVSEAVARRQPALQLFPGCRFSRHLEALARRLCGGEGEATRLRGDPTPLAAPRNGAGAVARHLVATRGSLPPLDLAEPGAYLRRCREQLGLSLEEMTERTRIRGLDHVEGEHFELLPPEPYLKGFVLEYARELGVPQIEDLAASYLGRYRRVGAARAR